MTAYVVRTWSARTTLAPYGIRYVLNRFFSNHTKQHGVVRGSSGSTNLLDLILVHEDWDGCLPLPFQHRGYQEISV